MSQDTTSPSDGGSGAATADRRSGGAGPNVASPSAGIDGILIRIHAVIWYSDMRDSTRRSLWTGFCDHFRPEYANIGHLYRAGYGVERDYMLA